MDDHEVPVGHDHARLIFQRRRDALDQIEETVAAGLDMSAVLDVVGRPVALSGHIVSLVEQRIEGLEDKRFVLRLLGPTHILLQIPWLRLLIVALWKLTITAVANPPGQTRETKY